MGGFLIIDTHVHVVSDDRTRYPVRDNPPDWPVVTGGSLAAELDATGVGRALLVQSFFTYGFDNGYAIDCAAADPDRFQVVAVIDQTDPGAPGLLGVLVQERGVRGVRLMPKGMPEGVLWDPRTFGVWAAAEELGVPVTVAAEAPHVPYLARVIERFPGVTVCLEHMWGIEIDKPPFPALAPVAALARFPNVHLKLAPNNSFAARAAAVPARALYDHLIEHFGIDRMLWGSNYPAHPARFGSYADRLSMMRADLSYLDEAGQRAFFGGNAARLWPAGSAVTGESMRG
jgi:predicted TIM-barrel fold metal-dependent hydrolase